MKKIIKLLSVLFLVSLVSIGAFNIRPANAETTTNNVPNIISIGIKPDTPTRIANSSTFVTQGQTLEFDLLDINGNPVSYGNYTGTVTITGPAYFNGYGKNHQSSELKVKNGKGKITFYVMTDTFPGEITITPHFSTLLNRTFKETLFIPGRPGNATQVVLSIPQETTSFNLASLNAKGVEPFLTYKLQAEDAQGNATVMNAPSLSASVTFNGQLTDQFTAVLADLENGSYSVTLSLKNNLNQSTFKPGTYTVTITPNNTSNTLFEPITESFTVTNNES